MLAVAEVLRYARPDAPEKVSQRRFDDARVPAGQPDCPTARAITMRFNERATSKFTWDSIKELALDSGRSLTQTLAAAEREDPAEHLDERHVFFALRFVAQRSKLAAPARDQYAEQRAKLLAAARRRGDDTLTELLPTVGQIERLFDGNWNAALEAADLVRVKPKAVPPPRPTGLDPAEVMRHFVKANGWWPTQQVLDGFAKDVGVRLARRQKPIAAYRAEAARLLADEGVVVLASDPPPDASTREVKLPPGGIPGAPTNAPDKQWDEPACVDALARWLRQLPTTAKTTKTAYIGFARGKPDFPAASAFDDYGGFAAVRTKAKRMNAEVIPF